MLLLQLLSTILLVSSEISVSEENFDQLQRCVSKIQQIYNAHNYTVYINDNENYRNLQLGQVPIMVNTKLDGLKYFRKFKAAFYVIVPSANLRDTFFNLTQTYHWNPRAKFVVVLDALDEELFTIARKYHVFNIVALIQTDTDVEIISYFPFETSSPVVLGKCVDLFFSSTNLFPDKLPKTWTNTTVRTLAFPYPPYVFNDHGFIHGMEIDALNLIQSVVKFKIVYVNKSITNWGRKLKNGSYEGAFSYFRNYEIDLGIGMFYANNNNFWDFDETYPYMEDNAKWSVPMAKLQERWYRVLGIFTFGVWILIFTFFGWVSGLLLLVGEKRYERIWDCLTKCYQCFFGQSVELPKTGFLRVVLGLWVCLALLITATFQGRLISVLNTNVRNPQITNVEELIASKIKFGFYKDGGLLFLRPDNENDRYIYNNFEECPADSTCLNRVAFNGDFATIKSKKFTKYMISSFYLDEYGNSLVYMFDSNIMNVLVTMLFARGFPLYERINLISSRMRSAGFIERYYQKAEYLAEKAIESVKKTEFVFQVLTMDEVFWMFWFFLFGLSFGSIVFVGEVCVYKWRQRMRTRMWVP